VKSMPNSSMLGIVFARSHAIRSKRAGKSYALTGGEALSTAEMVAVFSEVLGKSIETSPRPKTWRVMADVP
jgi:uncharacterized protein YbjT (DUF2867 family)